MPNIAIIDNEPALAKLYEDALASRGHNVAFLASNCAEALERIKTAEKTPDMLVVCADHESAALGKIKAAYPAIIVKEIQGKGRKKL